MAESSPQQGSSRQRSPLNLAYRNALYQTMIFEGFIQEFGEPNIRQAFLRGSLNVPENDINMLKCLDAVRGMIMPSLFRSESKLHRDSCAIAGVAFFANLLEKTGAYPVDQDGQSFMVIKTFAEWFNYFEILSSSVFWRSGAGSGSKNLGPVDLPLNPDLCSTFDSFGGSLSAGDVRTHTGLVTEAPSFKLRGEKNVSSPSGNTIDDREREHIDVELGVDMRRLKLAEVPVSSLGLRSAVGKAVSPQLSVRPKEFVDAHGKREGGERAANCNYANYFTQGRTWPHAQPDDHGLDLHFYSDKANDFCGFELPLAEPVRGLV